MASYERTLDATLRVSVEFEYSPALPGHAPSMSDPGDPPVPAEVDITAIYVGDAKIDLKEVGGEYINDIACALIDRMEAEAESYRASRRSGAYLYGRP